MTTELEKINKIVDEGTEFKRDQNGRLIRNPNYKPPMKSEQEEKENKKEIVVPVEVKDVETKKEEKPKPFNWEKFNDDYKKSQLLIRDKNGRLIRNPDYVAPKNIVQEEQRKEIQKKQVPIEEEIKQKQKETKIATPPVPSNYKKAIEKNGTDVEMQSYIENTSEESTISTNGIFGDKLLEPIPQYIEAPCEKVIQGENNSYLVFGRDRTGTREDGYGMKGETQAGSIDMVVGRLGYETRKVNENNEQLWVDPNFKLDSARMYISQKTDVDDSFNLARGKVGISKTKSAIALKADGIRIIAREGVKIVTGVDERNSQGGDIRVISGVDIIANNDDADLQPMTKGKNLQKALERLTNHIDKLNGIVNSFLITQMEYNKHLMGHFHYSPFFGIPDTPSEILLPAGSKCLLEQLTKVQMSLLNHKRNLASFRITFLSVYGKKYINSRFNNVN